MSDIFRDFDAVFGGGGSDLEQENKRVPTPPPTSLSGGDDPELLEIEKKLAKASYYKELVSRGVMEEDGTQEASEINAEVRLWARQQMARLVGRVPVEERQSAVTQSPFTDQQVEILRKIADRVLRNEGGAAGPPPPKPTVKVLQQTRKRRELVQQKPSQALVPDPIAQPQQQPPPQVAPPRPSVAKPAQQPLPKAPPDADQTWYDAIPDGVVFLDKDGKTYKFVQHPTIEGQRAKLSANRPVVAPKALPMPKSKEQFEMLLQNQAMQAASLGAASNTIFPDEGKNAGNFTTIAVANSLKE